MEFEEMRKIWDTQNKEPIYVLNEKAMRKRILSSKNKTIWIANTNEIGLMIIAVLTSSYLIYRGINTGNMYAALPVLGLLFTGIYVLTRRVERKKRENQFDRTMLGDLDHAISIADYHVTFAKTFIWWYMMPVIVPIAINMIVNDTSLWKWIIIPLAMLLSYSIVNYELRKSHVPRKKRLEALRKELVKEIDFNSDDSN